VHVLIVLLFGSVILFRRTSDPADFSSEGESFILQGADAPEPPASPEIADIRPETMAAGQASVPLQVITAMAPVTTSFELPASRMTMPSELSRSFEQRVRSSATGAGSGSTAGTGSGMGGKGGGSGMRFGTLFGKRVEAKKLGVILDVSGSAVPFLPEVLKQIQKDFADATLVLVDGCGMGGDSKKAEVDALVAGKAKKSVADLWARFMEFKKSFYAHGGKGSSHHAFEKLLEEKVDAIYWFADFADDVDANLAGKLTDELSEKQVKVYLHSFAGREPPEPLGELVKKVKGDVIKTKP
jgi:hypothetical protein